MRGPGGHAQSDARCRRFTLKPSRPRNTPDGSPLLGLIRSPTIGSHSPSRKSPAVSRNFS